MDRGLVAAVSAVVLVLYLPTALLVDSYPVTRRGHELHRGLPRNAFKVIGSEPAFVADVVCPLREFARVALVVAVDAAARARLRAATPLMRRTLEPVLVVAIFRCVSFVLAILARRIAPDADVQSRSWMWRCALPCR